MRFVTLSLRAALVAGTATLALGAPAMAEEAIADDAAADAASDAENVIIVFGKGETRQVQAVSAADITIQLPATYGSAEVDAWLSWSDRREQDYQDMSQDMLARLGYGWDNAFPDHDLAILLADIGNNRGDTGAPVSNPAAGTVYPGNVTSVDGAHFEWMPVREPEWLPNSTRSRMDFWRSYSFGEELSPLLDRAFEVHNPEVVWTDNMHQGYVRLELEKAGALASFVAVDTILEPDYRSFTLRRFPIRRDGGTVKLAG